MSEHPKNHGTYFVPGLYRGLRVLEILAEAEHPMTVSEIGREMDLSRSSVFRLVYTLRHMGFVEDADGGHSVTLGPRVLNLGFSYLAGQSLIQIARPVLEELTETTGISSHLAILESKEVLFLDCVQSRLGYLSNVNVGHRFPAYASPLGWHLLSDRTEDEIAAMFERTPMRPFTDLTPTDTDALIQAVGAARARRAVVSHGIAEAGGRSVSAPVRNAEGRVVAAIDISGPKSVFREEAFDTLYVPAVQKAGAQLSIRLGLPAQQAGAPQTGAAEDTPL
ncbi:IclR family transcriptional regulator [Rhodobacteraceae bacterium CCMM004]|nr:IclR family transcriptional regulator [Rhodobacteraceae bacterium CCMM004]